MTLKSPQTTTQHTHDELTPILHHIRKHIYHQRPKKQYHQDKKMLLYAITWPATWLKNKHLHIQSKHYNHIIITKINDIKQHGNPQQYAPYFPRYLLKTLQDHFAHNEDKLYYELKSIAYSINPIITAINHLPNTPNAPYLNTIAQAHHIIKNQYQQKKPPSQTNQMTLEL